MVSFEINQNKQLDQRVAQPAAYMAVSIYTGMLFISFFNLLREVVFFEELLIGAEALNANPNWIDNERLSLLSSTRSPSRKSFNSSQSGLREQLMTINYDRAREEEFILNRVFPVYEDSCSF